ncbi:MAG: hypothetical protein FWE31_02565 [Firmicutes bacterium]|nr:hypothetical protein [Bacillota bacterium]
MDKIHLTSDEYEMLKDWAKSNKNEQSGIISATRDDDKIIPARFLLSDRFTKRATSTWVRPNRKEQKKEINNSEHDLHILMHTHPGNDGEHTGISGGDIRSFRDENKLYENKEIFMGIVSENNISFWMMEGESLVQMEVFVDEKSLEQPDVLEASYQVTLLRHVHRIKKIVLGALGIVGGAATISFADMSNRLNKIIFNDQSQQSLNEMSGAIQRLVDASSLQEVIMASVPFSFAVTGAILAALGVKMIDRQLSSFANLKTFSKELDNRMKNQELEIEK